MAKNKIEKGLENKDEINEEVPAADLGDDGPTEEAEPNVPQAADPEPSPEKVPEKADKKTGAKVVAASFKSRYGGDFKSDIVIDGEKHQIVCKKGVITTESDVVAHHLRKSKYQEIK